MTADDFAKIAANLAQLAAQLKPAVGAKYGAAMNEAAVYIRLAAAKLRTIAEATAGDESK